MFSRKTNKHSFSEENMLSSEKHVSEKHERLVFLTCTRSSADQAKNKEKPRNTQERFTQTWKAILKRKKEKHLFILGCFSWFSWFTLVSCMMVFCMMVPRKKSLFCFLSCLYGFWH
jgi:hypothetical protein